MRNPPKWQLSLAVACAEQNSINSLVLSYDQKLSISLSCHYLIWRHDHAILSLEMAALCLTQTSQNIPDSKVHWANMGPISGWQDPGWHHVVPMNLAIWGELFLIVKTYHLFTVHEVFMSLCQYGKSHCEDKTVVRSSYLHNGFPILVRWHLYWIRALFCTCRHSKKLWYHRFAYI